MVLPIPDQLEMLIVAGRWPSSSIEEQQQTSVVPAQRIAAFAPEEDHLCLHAPPFHTVTQRLARGEKFWGWPCSAPQGIEHDKTIVIGDFGLGSDAPIVLDYRSGSPPPRVLRLRWGTRPKNNEWVEVAPSFAHFVELLGLSCV